MELTKECKNCGKIFEPTCHITRQKYCSDACRMRYNNTKRSKGKTDTCPECGDHVEQIAQSGRSRRFRSDSCRIQWWKEYHKANPKEIVLERKCIHCGQEYNGSRWHDGEYCSRDCYLAEMAKSHVKTICAWCGEEFSSLASRDRKYCGTACATAARHNPPGPVKARRRISYCNPEEWRKQLREAIQ